MAEDLPLDMVVKTRDECVADAKRDYQLRSGNADVSGVGQPAIDAAVLADQLAPIYANAQNAGRASTARFATGTKLRNIAQPVIGDPNGATPSTGSVKVSTSAGGAALVTNAELVEPKSKMKFRYIGSPTTVFDQNQVSVQSVDVGPQTNLAAGTLLQWSSPSPGLGQNASIVAQSDGTGLSDGRAAETDDDYRERLFEAWRNPKAMGNSANVIADVFATPNLSIQAVFVYEAIFGPGVTAIAFLLPPSSPGASRAPNATQRAIVQQRIAALYSGADFYLVATDVPVVTTVSLKLAWKTGAQGYVDQAPWPVYNAVDKVKVDGAVARTPTSFRLTTTQAQTTPQVGQTIAFLDMTLDAASKPQAKFRNKRIGAVVVVVPNLSWDITVDTTNGASDTSFTPAIGALASPWSPSLTDVAVAVLQHFDALGLGEMVATFPDPGGRQRRTPFNPDAWAASLTNTLVDDVQALPAVSSATVKDPALPLAPAVGTPGTSVNYLTLGDLAVYAS